MKVVDRFPPINVTIGRLEKSAGQELRVALTEDRGAPLVEVRDYRKDRVNGELEPTRKGVAFSPELLPELIAVLRLTVIEARAKGLLL